MLNVLYVEDDPASRDVLRILQRINPGFMQLTVFDNSKDFEERLLALDPQPDLALLDIHMKPYTGFDMLGIIRSHREYDRTPVVALTASVMNEEVQLLKEAGFHGVLAKPLDLDEFPQVIQRIVKGERVWHVW